MADGTCTSCGAPLPAPDLAGLITCPTCGRVTRADGFGGSGWPAPPVAAPPPGGWAAPAPVAGAPPAPPPPERPTGAARASRGGRGWFAAAAVLAVMVVVVTGTIRSCASSTDSSTARPPVPGSSSTFALGGTATVVAAAPGRTDLVATVQATDGSTTERRLALLRFTDTASSVVWRSEPIGESAYRAVVAFSGDTLFAGVDDQLYALDARSGATRWRTTLHDKVSTDCQACFGVAGGNLVVRTTDAYVTAFGIRSSEPLWSRRLESPSGRSSVVGGRVLVVDDPTDPEALTAVELVDPASGRTIRSTTPTCPKNPDTPWRPEIGPDDPITEVGTQHDVVAAFGFGDACVVRWNPAAGTVKWTSRLDGASSLSRDVHVVGPHDLVVAATGGAIVAVDLTTGVARQLEVPADVRATPDRIVGRTLVADTVTARGTPKGGLAAWDLGSGARLWDQARLGTAQPVSSRSSSSDALFDGSPRSLLVPSGEGINVMVFDGTDRTFSVRSVDLGSGDLGTEVKRGFLARYESGIPSLAIEAVEPTQVLVSIDSTLQAVPVSGRGAVVGFPSG